MGILFTQVIVYFLSMIGGLESNHKVIGINQGRDYCISTSLTLSQAEKSHVFQIYCIPDAKFKSYFPRG